MVAYRNVTHIAIFAEHNVWNILECSFPNFAYHLKTMEISSLLCNWLYCLELNRNEYMATKYTAQHYSISGAVPGSVLRAPRVVGLL